MLDLPQGMKDCRIHNEFHVSRLRPYHASDADRFPVHWAIGDNSWEPLENCEALMALDDYITLHGVKEPRDLSQTRPTKPGSTGERTQPQLELARRQKGPIK